VFPVGLPVFAARKRIRAGRGGVETVGVGRLAAPSLGVWPLRLCRGGVVSSGATSVREAARAVGADHLRRTLDLETVERSAVLRSRQVTRAAGRSDACGGRRRRRAHRRGGAPVALAQRRIIVQLG
jgi:hypothetical protein